MPFVDMSEEYFGKYQHCTKRGDYWFADSDTTLRGVRDGALPSPFQHTKEEIAEYQASKAWKRDFRKPGRTALPVMPHNGSDDAIIAALDPWTLACAVGADNGTVGGRYMGFDLWLDLSKQNWLPEAKERLGFLTGTRIIAALRSYVAANRHLHMSAVMAMEQQKRGQHPSPVLGPGESMTIEVPLSHGPDKAPRAEEGS